MKIVFLDGTQDQTVASMVVDGLGMGNYIRKQNTWRALHVRKSDPRTLAATCISATGSTAWIFDVFF